MPATGQALMERLQGQSLQAACAQINPGNPQNLDLIHICDQGDNTILTVDYAGAVHNAPATHTAGTRFGKFHTRLTTGALTAALFADVFTNPSLLDILQVINIGGNISYYLNYAGVATGS